MDFCEWLRAFVPIKDTAVLGIIYIEILHCMLLQDQVKRDKQEAAAKKAVESLLLCVYQTLMFTIARGIG